MLPFKIQHGNLIKEAHLVSSFRASSVSHIHQYHLSITSVSHQYHTSITSVSHLHQFLSHIRSQYHISLTLTVLFLSHIISHASHLQTISVSGATNKSSCCSSVYRTSIRFTVSVSGCHPRQSYYSILTDFCFSLAILVSHPRHASYHCTSIHFVPQSFHLSVAHHWSTSGASQFRQVSGTASAAPDEAQSPRRPLDPLNAGHPMQ
jgi:hypothetical protein